MENVRKRAEWLNPPERCDECGSHVIRYTNNKILYKKPVGEWPYIWHCDSCKAAVGCHYGTFYPLGKMANYETRQARSLAHKWFDKIHKQYRFMSRTGAYTWLAEQMNMKRAECHIAHFNRAQCEEVVRLSKRRIKQGQPKKGKLTHIRGRKVVKPGERRKY